jgi:hypothetical protein
MVAWTRNPAAITTPLQMLASPKRLMPSKLPAVLAKQFQLTQNLLFVNTSASIRADRLGALEAPDVNLVWS